MPTYKTSAGQTIKTHRELGKGGEGAIYDISGRNDVVAKVYHLDERTRERDHKLQVMIASPPQDDMRHQSPPHISIAWPTELVYEQGRFAGFLMPLIVQSPNIYKLYNPQSRAENYSSFNWRYLHRTATNLATALNALHARGYVMGDVNQNNVLVTASALVTLIDTDSFQVSDSNGQVYRSQVGVAEYTPPELQGKRLESIDREIHHDLFGLAVIVFQLLMEGWHPFTGAQKAPSKSVGEAYVYCIKQGIFPYQSNKEFNPPPAAPNFDALHPEVQKLFQRCFVEGHKDPPGRPTAREWLGVLNKAERALVRCRQDSSHWHSNHLRKCPWCERDKQKPLPTQQPLPPTGTQGQGKPPTSPGQNPNPPQPPKSPPPPAPPPANPPPVPSQPPGDPTFRGPALVVVLLIILGVAGVGGYFAATTPAPNFTGLSFAEAAERANRTDFEIYIASATESSRPRGAIVGQSPSPDERIADRQVGLTVSGGQREVGVPDVGGMSKSEACKALMQSGINSQRCGGLSVGGGGELVFTANGSDWTVDGTDPPAGTEVEAGASASLEYRFQQAFQDDFSNTDSGWPVTKNEDSGNYYADGGYRMYNTDGYRWALIGEVGTIDAVVVGVDAVTSSGVSSDGNSGWGIVCRAPDLDNFYTMTVWGDGTASIGKVEGEGRSTLDTGDAGNALSQGEANHIQGSCVGDTLRLYVNGQQVAEAEDGEFDSGEVGLFAEEVQDGEVRFDNFVVGTPDGKLTPDTNSE